MVYLCFHFQMSRHKSQTDFLTTLHSQFKSVVTLYDNDPTGLKMAIRNQEANGLPFINIGEIEPNFKDVCEIFKGGGIASLVRLCEIGLNRIERQKIESISTIQDGLPSSQPLWRKIL